jgi:hypothetical protein
LPSILSAISKNCKVSYKPKHTEYYRYYGRQARKSQYN